MNEQKLEVVVIGGGAAGFFGAIACTEANPHAKVTILEAGTEPLSKVRISGGGRCNVTHHCFEPSQLVQNYPRGSQALRGAFARFQPKNTVEWFQSRGVQLKTEADGRMFPVTDKSETIVNCLTNTANKRGVILHTNSAVKTVTQLSREVSTDTEKKQWQIELKNSKILRCDRIMIATGSNPSGYRWARQLEHTIETPVPSLFTFKIKDSRLQGLAGISTDYSQVTLLNAEPKNLAQTGALLITHWGLSAPAILKLSAWGARILHEHQYHLPLRVNWLPQYNRETLKSFLLELKTKIPKRKIFTYCPLKLPKRLWQNLAIYIGIKPDKTWAELNKQELNKLLIELLQGEYQITGKGVFKDEFVTCGGVSLKEINFKTMESKICSNLYFAGEILDIDGLTGGFNFQSAWTTGWIAGNAMAKLIG
jgi:predicted Rossmann fold flavoprotein